MISSITGVSLLSFSWCHTQRGDGDLCLRRHQPVTVQSGGQPANQETGDTGEGPLTPREGEELSGCLKLSSPLAHPPQGFRNQSFFSKAIKMKPETEVNRWTRMTSLFVAPMWHIVTWLMLVTGGCEVTLARQTRGGVTLTGAGSTQEPRNPRNWHPSGSRVSLYLRVYSCSLSSIPSIPEFLCVYAFNVRAPKHLRTPNTNFTFGWNRQWTIFSPWLFVNILSGRHQTRHILINSSRGASCEMEERHRKM